MAYDHSTHRRTLGYTDFSSGVGAMQGFQSSQDLYGLQQAAAAGMDIMGRTFFPPTVAAATSSAVPPPLISENNLLCPWPAAPQSRMLLDVESSSSSARFLFPAEPPQCEPPPMAAPSSSGLSLSLNYALANYPRDNQQQQPPQLLKNSKFLIPARELLNEFCNLETAGAGGASKSMAGKSKQQREAGRPSTFSNPINQSALYTSDIYELQARKAKLMAMLEEEMEELMMNLSELNRCCISMQQQQQYCATTICAELRLHRNRLIFLGVPFTLGNLYSDPFPEASRPAGPPSLCHR